MRHTRIGPYLYDWAPYVRSSYQAKHLLLACLVSPVAKQWLPGLMYAPLGALAEGCRMGFVEAQESIRELIDAGAIEHDAERRVVRVTSLPDRGERPQSPKAIIMFWRKWRELPATPLKYRHIETLEWLTETHRTENILSTWTETFGTVVVPDTLSDTLSNGYPIGTDRVSTPIPVDNLRTSGQVPLFNQDSDTPSNGMWKKVDGSRKPVASSVSVSGSAPSPAPAEITNTRAPAKHKPCQSGVPGRPPTAFNVAELLDAIGTASLGRVTTDILDPRLGDELWRLAEICTEADVGLDDVKLAGEYLAAGFLHYRNDLDVRWLAGSGNLLSAVSKARSWRDAGKPAVNGSGGARRDRGPSVEDFMARAARLEAEGR